MPSKGKRKHGYDDAGCTYGDKEALNPHQHESTGAASMPQQKITPSTSRLLTALDGRKTPPQSADSSNSASEQDDSYAGMPKLKRTKKSKGKDSASDRPVPEKRAARFKSACPKNILERVERVVSQRFFMIDRRRDGGELREEFSVLGSTGNVYTVTIDHIPSCDCPDAQKGNHCKHILFIFLKVLQVPQRSTYWYQKALLTSELEELFRNAPAAPNAVANARIRDAYAVATGRASASPSKDEHAAATNRRMPGKDDDCPICYESMHDVHASSLIWCETCGNALHQQCFNQWKRTGTSLTCVYCRAPWPTASGGKGKGKANTSEGYLNLSSVAGVNHVRDTSTYYQGPRRGGRYYGYQDYDFED